MIRRLLTKQFHVPPWLVGLRGQAVILAAVGAVWLAAAAVMTLNVKGYTPLVWWWVAYMLPLPLTLWGIWFFASQVRQLAYRGALDGLLFAAGLIGGALPLVTILLMCGSAG